MIRKIIHIDEEKSFSTTCAIVVPVCSMPMA